MIALLFTNNINIMEEFSAKNYRDNLYAKGESIQAHIAKTFVQSEEKILVGGHEFTYPPLTMATVSMLGSYLPKKTEELNGETEFALADLLALAEDNESLPKTLATVILGADRISQKKHHIEAVEHEISEKTEEVVYKYGFIPKRVKSAKNMVILEDVDFGEELDYWTFIFDSKFRISDVQAAYVKIMNNNPDTAFFLNYLISQKGVMMMSPTKSIEE